MIKTILALFRKYEWLIGGVLAVVVVLLLFSAFSGISNYITNRKVAKLENQVTAAEQNVTKLQGVVEEKEKDIASLNEALNESNKQVSDAGKTTDSVRTTYITVRNSNPAVPLSDTALVQSVGAKLSDLYPRTAGDGRVSK